MFFVIVGRHHIKAVERIEQSVRVTYVNSQALHNHLGLRLGGRRQREAKQAAVVLARRDEAAFVVDRQAYPRSCGGGRVRWHHRGLARLAARKQGLANTA